MKVSACFFVFNEERFLPYSLASVYDFADQIVVVEGAIKLFWHLATPEGSSTDKTVELIKGFPDPQGKISMVQGKWSDKYQMENEYLKHATGDWILVCAGDEVYDPEDLPKLREAVKQNPSLVDIRFPFVHFIWDEDHMITCTSPKPNMRDWTSKHQRFYRHPPGVLYQLSHSDVEDSQGLMLLMYPSGMRLWLPTMHVYHYGYCLREDTLIITDNGPKKVRDVKNGQKVLTDKGIWKSVTDVTTRIEDKNLIEIVSSYTNIPLYLTPEHEVLAVKSKKCQYGRTTICKPICKYHGQKSCKKLFKDYKIEWIPAASLNIGDFVLFPISNETKDINKITISDIVNGNFKTVFGMIKPRKGGGDSIPDDINLNEDFMRLIGYYLAEGYTSKNMTQFTFNSKETFYIRDVANLTKNIFQKSASVKRCGNIVQVKLFSVIVSKLFHTLFGSTSLEKRLPEAFLKLPNDKLKSIVLSFWRGDGDTAPTKFGFTTVSPVLAFQLKIILHRLGIIPSISFHNNEKSRKGIWRATIGGSQLENVSSILLSKHSFIRKRNHNYQRGWIDKKFVYNPIKKIQTVPFSGLVFNLEVDKDESYTTLQCCVHNCKSPDEIRQKLTFMCQRDNVHLKHGFQNINDYVVTHPYFSGKTDPRMAEQILPYKGKKLGILK